MEELQKLIESFVESLSADKREKFLKELDEMEEFTASNLISLIENYEEDVEEEPEQIDESPELSAEFVEMLKNMILNPASSGDMTSPEHKAMNDGPKVGQEDSELGEDEEPEGEGQEDEVAEKQNAKAKENQEPSKLKEDFSFDFSDEIGKIFEGDEFTPEFKEQAKVILETSVKSKAKTEIEAFKNSFEKSLNEHVSEQLVAVKNTIEESVNRYLDKVVKDWYEDNKLAVDTGIRVEIAESIFKGIKNVISENDVIIPEESVNVYESLQEEKAKLDELYKGEVDRNIELTKKLEEFEKNEIIKGLTEGMIDNDAEKLVSLCNELPYVSEKKEEFLVKANLLKEHVGKGATKDTVKVGTKVISEDYDSEATETKVVSPDVQIVLDKLKSLI